jgi:Tol biopolymer transport system component
MSAVRLDSWKEIAAYLNRDVRTVQRWEKQEGLPVHRHLHDERSSAYAFSNEIDEWLKGRAGHDDVVTQPVVIGPSELAKELPVAGMRPVWRLVAVALAVVTGIMTWAIMRGPSAASPLSSLSVVFGPSERFREWGPDMALSPDGSTLVYGGSDVQGTREQLRVRRIDRLESRVLEGVSGFAPFFSPDGRWIGFYGAEQLMKVSIDGGTPVPLGVSSNRAGAADWGADNFIVYADLTPQGTHGLFRISADGGTPQLVAALDGNSDDAYWLTPQSIDNGRVIICTVSRAVSSGPRFQVVAVSVATGERRVVVDDAKHGLYLGDGVLVYLRDSGLFATRFDLNRLETTGAPVAAWDNVFERERRRSWTYANGTLVYWPSWRVSRRLVWVDRNGKQELLPMPPAMYQSPRVSPDGKRIAYSVAETAEYGDIWSHDLGTGDTVRLTSDHRSGTPIWNTDGTAIIYSTLHSTGRDLMRLRLGIAATPEPIPMVSGLLQGASKEPLSWADNGRTLLVSQSGFDSQPLLWSVELNGARELKPVFARDMKTGKNSRISPNGRWIAYEAGNAQTDVFVAPLQGGPPFWKVSSDGGALPVWSTSGRELFYRAGSRMMVVAVTPDGTFSSAEPRTLFEGRYFEADPGGPNYDVARDDQRFLMVLSGDTDGPDRLNVVQGWKPELLRRLSGDR